MYRVFSLIHKSAFSESFIGKALVRVLSVEAIGRFAFRFSIVSKQFWLILGHFSQRAAEYPWILQQIKNIQFGSIVLDIGSAESLLSHELTSKGFRVVSLDIRPCPFANKKTLIVKRNIMNTVLPDNFFDAIIMVSTIEHIGLSAYKQLTLEDDGDFKAISELYRILKPNGVLLMSTPYIGKNPFRVDSFERNYNRDRLNRLVHEFKIEKENYFYPQKIRRHVYWQKVNPRAIDEHFFTFPGIACLILRKSS